MILLLMDDGHLLDKEDSGIYIIWKIQDEFTDLRSFKTNIEVQKPSYWGEYILNRTEEDYRIWINQIAESFLK
jgi:hypothetical protein